MGQAEVISLDAVRASKQWASLRQQLHDYFDLWLDDLQAKLPNPETPLTQITETMWDLRQDLTGSLTAAWSPASLLARLTTSRSSKAPLSTITGMLSRSRTLRIVTSSRLIVRLFATLNRL